MNFGWFLGISKDQASLFHIAGFVCRVHCRKMQMLLLSTAAAKNEDVPVNFLTNILTTQIASKKKKTMQQQALVVGARTTAPNDRTHAARNVSRCATSSSLESMERSTCCVHVLARARPSPLYRCRAHETAGPSHSAIHSVSRATRRASGAWPSSSSSDP
jgi:hypothetical protein